MKTSRFKIAALVLLAATVAFVVALAVHMWNHYAWLAEQAESNVFISAILKGEWVIGLFVLAVLWTTLGSLKASKGTWKKVTMLALLAPLVFSMFPACFADQSGPFITVRDLKFGLKKRHILSFILIVASIVGFMIIGITVI
ncbi:MAG: hypothetical protein OEW62_04025 [Candidatus Bathyarchaeota archaeon]|nr:hypothetical protein [Candidatus Bathyarchaeota archaeon]MDH5745489.1 hypothetical protein [Candidatus Bathyarchaeota archaeon]